MATYGRRERTGPGAPQREEIPVGRIIVIVLVVLVVLVLARMLMRRR
ncbi:hypothetical protein [Nocardioides aequoreus]|nr:hypothetical protein [Nocardioides aequoreus]